MMADWPVQQLLPVTHQYQPLQARTKKATCPLCGGRPISFHLGYRLHQQRQKGIIKFFLCGQTRLLGVKKATFEAGYTRATRIVSTRLSVSLRVKAGAAAASLLAAMVVAHQQRQKNGKLFLFISQFMSAFVHKLPTVGGERRAGLEQGFSTVL